MKPQVAVTPAELDWISAAIFDGATFLQMAEWQTERFEKSRSVASLKSIIYRYGLGPSRCPQGEAEHWDLSLWEGLQAHGRVRLAPFRTFSENGRSIINMRYIRASMRWLVRSEAAHLYGRQPGEGIGSKTYRKTKAIYLNEEYPSWTPWSN